MRLLLVLWSIGMLRGQPGRVALAAGDTHGVLLRSEGTVWTWGANDSGQLGRDGDDGWTPGRVPGLSGIVSVAAGFEFTMALKGDGTVWVWGGNQPVPGVLAGLPRIVAIAAGGKRALAVDSNGTVWDWGENAGSKPIQVQKLTKAIAIAVGDEGGIAVDANGQVWVWGDSSNPRQVPGLSNVIAVAGADGFLVGLKKDGTVWIAGANESSSDRPVMVTGLSGVKAVAARNRNYLALKSDGTVWAWGDNRFRQLGNPAIKSESSSKPVRVGALTGIAAIANGGDYAAAASSKGDVWTWGRNASGALGADAGDLERSDAPMRPGQPIPPKCAWERSDDAQGELFGCETASGKRIQICGVADPDDPEKWKQIHYRFGPESGPPDLMFPAHPETAAPSLFYSTERIGGDDQEVVRFSNGGYTYRVYYGLVAAYVTDGKKRYPTWRPARIGGVDVDDASGRRLSSIACTDAPHMESALSENLPYDPRKSGEMWAEIKDSPDPEDFDLFAMRFPNTDLARAAEARAGQLRNRATAPKGKNKVNPKDGLTYLWIPPGQFQMGCSPRDGECADDEKPAHSVAIAKGFWLGQTEVTQEAYERVTKTNPSLRLAERLPVQGVDWGKAKAYCEAVGMRLPTEAEWEYAARGGNASARYGDLNSIAWYEKNSRSYVHEVGLKEPNGFGLYDMLGNLWEWTSDLYGEYSAGGSSGGQDRVLRGGSWSSSPRGIRVSERLKYKADSRVNIVGFRCAGE